jgi:hypothetical protein
MPATPPSVRKCAKNIYSRTDPLHQPVFTILRLECLGLSLKYGWKYGSDGIASLQLSSKRIVEKRFPCLLLVLS